MQIRSVVIAALVLTSRVCADGLSDLETSCFQRANLTFGKYWLLECLQEVFTADPVHLTLGTIAPGAGTVALGPSFTMIPRSNRLESMITGSAVISTDTSWLFQAQAVIAVPSVPGATMLLRNGKTNGRFGGRLGALTRDAELDAKSSLTLRARAFDAKEQHFYGIGPSASLNGGTQYSQQEIDVSAGFNNPVTTWSSIGLNTDFLRPRILPPNGGVPVDTLYTPVSAPGLSLNEDFVRFEPYVSFKIPPRRSLATIGQVGFSWYHALDDARFSFRRLSASTVTQIPLRPKVHVGSVTTASHRNGFVNWICPSSRSGEHCSMGDLALIGLLDVTYDSAGNTPPFYLDPTLGGSDIQGNDTLRGFGDYRFRAPNRVLLQAEYRHPVWSFLGLLVFYDVGKVGLEPSDLTLSQLRHDLGLGVTVTVGRHEIARLYAAFGTGEPVQFRPKFGGLL